MKSRLRAPGAGAGVGLVVGIVVGGIVGRIFMRILRLAEPAMPPSTHLPRSRDRVLFDEMGGTDISEPPPSLDLTNRCLPPFHR
jgi:Na+/glutamate symporter